MDYDDEMASDQPCQELQPFDIFNQQLINTTDGAAAIYSPVFNGIRIYGTSDYPVFVAKDVQETLGLKNLHYKDEDRFEWEEDKIKIKVMTKGGMQQVIAFTEHGLYHAVWMSKTPAAKQFQRFITCVMKRLRMKGSVTMDQAVGDLEKENIRLKGTLKAYDIQMDAEHKTLLHYQSEHDELVIGNKNYGNALIKAQKRLEFDRDIDGCELQERLRRVMARTGRAVFVMLGEVPKEHAETYEYELDAFSEWDDDIIDPSDPMVFSIGFAALKSKVSIRKVYVHKTVKLEDVHKALVKHRLDKVRKGEPAGHYINMYEISLDQLDQVIDGVNLADEQANNE